jgi:diguanylate cyclase (GGDEF)-like protein
MKKTPNGPSRNILIVEDSTSISGFLCRQIEETLRFQSVPAYTLVQALEILDKGDDFFVAILDLNLPDAPNGEIVDEVLRRNIPAVILTASFDEDLREKILARNVVDYVLKDSPRSLDHVKHLVQRIFRNQGISVLLVDDSEFFRTYCRQLLEAHKFHVLEAQNGREGLELLDSHPGIRLIITDYNMPEMDGFELVARVRERFGRNEVGIIGLSTQGSGTVSARFLKTGANDFLPKPFAAEEFYARVSQNVELIEFIDELKEVAIRDPLTRLYNRRYCFEAGERLLQEAAGKGIPVTVAMLDIDRFKDVNDRYGHEAGDAVLVCLADRLSQSFGRAHIVSRFGGEEFTVIAYGIHGDRAIRFFEDFRLLIENAEVRYGRELIRFTVSIGLFFGTNEPLDHMIREADRQLYRSKRDGRNRVMAGS